VSIAATQICVWCGGVGLESSRLDTTISVFNLLGCVYLHIAIGRVYGGRYAARALGATLLTVAAAGLVLGYRFALFLLTLYTT
jgi:hypothetical protein